MTTGNERKKISVIIPSYKSQLTIERCVESVIETGYRPLEIIVVDDCSPDDTFQFVDERVVKKHPDFVQQIVMDQNGGPAKARNAGAKIATGELLFFLDSDTDMLPDALDNFATRMEEAEADAVVGIYDVEPLNKGAVPLYKAFVNYYFFDRLGVIDYEVFDSSRAGIKAEVFKAIGGFNEDLGWGMDYENEEIGYRIHESYKMVLDPTIAVKHMFPGFKKLTRVYFLRVALWMKVFLQRKKFESGGVTSAGTGIASAACLGSVMSLVASGLAAALGFSTLAGFGLALTALCFLVYLYGYLGLFSFMFRHKPSYLPMGILLNIYFTLVIASGAFYGLLQGLFGPKEETAI